VFLVCCVGSGLCDELITHSEESYCVCDYVNIIVYDLETSTMRLPRPELGYSGKTILFLTVIKII